MNSNIKIIDYDTWDRNYIFDAYKGTDFPYINIGCDLDITNLYQYVKEEDLSLYFSMIYAATKIANEVKNFGYRFEGDQIYWVERQTAFATHLQKGTDKFVMVECDDHNTLSEYARRNRTKADLPYEKGNLAAVAGRMDIINFTCIPWIKYTHFVRTIAHAGQDCNPKMSMGKFEEKDGRIIMPFSSQTHHGLTDGYHVGMFFNRLQEYLDDREWE